MTLAGFTLANLKTIAGRVLGTFVIAFLTALGGDATSWTVSIAEKAALAGVIAAAELVRSLIWTAFSGAPQITPSGRASAKA